MVQRILGLVGLQSVAGAMVAMIGLLLVFSTPSAAQPFCTGDCNRDGAVTISEFATCQSIANGSVPLTTCPACDGNGDGVVDASEIAAARAYQRRGCQFCVGDCNGDGVVGNEIATCEEVANGTVPLDNCRACDGNGDGVVSPDEVAAAQENEVRGCPRGACTGDCNFDYTVTTDEVTTCQSIASGSLPLASCFWCDANGDGTVSPAELAAAQENESLGCLGEPAQPPTTPPVLAAPLLSPQDPLGRAELAVLMVVFVFLRLRHGRLTD